MNRIVMGALAALLLASAGVFWWQGRADVARGVPPPDISGSGAADDRPVALPSAGAHGRGAALPGGGSARASQSAEDRAFSRYDKKRSGQFTRNQMLATRVKAFEKLDVNHDNLLSFEEWAVKTSDRFKAMDANHDGIVTRAEYHAWYAAHHKPKKPGCACSPAHGPADAGAAAEDGSDGDEGDPTP